GFAGAGRVQTARLVQHDGGALDLPVDLVITCIGYHAVACCTLTPDGAVFANDEGRIAAGLYVVGWAKRGPSGTIATNRAEAQAVAQRLLGEAKPGDRPGTLGLARLVTQRGIRAVDFAAWQRIDAAERGRAAAGRPRWKLTTREA